MLFEAASIKKTSESWVYQAFQKSDAHPDTEIDLGPKSFDQHRVYDSRAHLQIPPGCEICKRSFEQVSEKDQKRTLFKICIGKQENKTGVEVLRYENREYDHIYLLCLKIVANPLDDLDIK